jgi:hypothetical protein
MIGRILRIDRSAAKPHFKKGAVHFAHAWPNGCSSMVSEDKHEELIRAIWQGYEMRRPMSMSEVNHCIETRHQKSIDRNPFWHVLGRDHRIESCNGVPREESRLDVTMDEIGHQDWADRTKQMCLVASDHPTSDGGVWRRFETGDYHSQIFF